jgi:hypothetical protein
MLHIPEKNNNVGSSVIAITFKWCKKAPPSYFLCISVQKFALGLLSVPSIINVAYLLYILFNVFKIHLLRNIFFLRLIEERFRESLRAIFRP